MRIAKLLSAVALTATAATSVAVAQSQPDPAAAIGARQATMQLYSYNLSTLGGMARGTIDYDAAAATAAAANLAALSGMDQRSYWLEGTDSESVEGTRALPALFENLDDVQAKQDALHEAATALEQTAGDGLEALQAGMGPVGGACGACHRPYQESR